MELLTNVRARDVDTARLRMHVYEAGPDDGEPVFLLHGNLSTGRFYEEVLAATREQFLTDLGEELHPMPGAIAIVRAAAARVPIACASNSWHEALEDKLTRAGIIDLFANLQSTDTVENGKPAPDMYAKAASELGVAPGECLALEDSAVGARAAVAAGLRLLAVPPHGGDVDEADLRIATLEDEGLLEWIATW